MNTLSIAFSANRILFYNDYWDEPGLIREYTMSLLEIKCPNCRCVMWIDPATGVILDHKAPEQKKMSFDDFVKTQKNRGSDLEDMFKKAKEEQAKRKEQIEKDFQHAKEHPEEFSSGDTESPFKWD